jgi:hypothetical protein
VCHLHVSLHVANRVSVGIRKYGRAGVSLAS